VTVVPAPRTSAPRKRSMRSVWSRERSGSVTAVSPAASSPASNSEDLTCAEATGER
jgi:hypothetical protein